MNIRNIAENLRILASSADTTVYYGNIKKNDDVIRAIESFKHLKADAFFK